MEESKKNLVTEFLELSKHIKGLFSTEAFKDFKLEDGSIIRIDTDLPQVGSKCTVLGTDGKEVAIPDGEYKITTDTGVIVCTIAAGYITEAETQGAADTEAPDNGTPPAQDPTQMNNEAMAKVEQMMSEFATRLAALEEKMGTAAMTTDVNSSIEKQGTDLKTEIANVLSKFESHEKFSKDLFALVEKLGENSADPINKPADKTKKPLTPIESVQAFRKQHQL